MEFFQLIFKEDQNKVVKFSQFFKFFLENVVIIGQFGFFIINVSFHEESFKSPFVTIQRLNLIFVDGHCSPEIVHFSCQIFDLLN